MSARVYSVQFADGKKATALDMEGRPPEQMVATIKHNFQPGYVLAVEPVNGGEKGGERR